MNIIKHKNLFFLLSGVVIIPGIISLLLWGLLPSIDFTGGSRLELSYLNSRSINRSKVEQVYKKHGAQIHNIAYLTQNTISIRSTPLDQKTKTKIVEELKLADKGISDKSFDTVGPVIGKETELNALKAVLIASLIITLYIAYTFRAVSRPVASWKFGVAAIVALLHDVLVVVGIFSLLGHFLKVEVDSLFITALLTVMGFSVHDTIVVFDRIRENLRRRVNVPFEIVVNNSILETFNRSLNTSLTVLLVLVALLLFGGENIRWFILALLIGIISGTYSSIFNAAPLLVAWYEWDKRRSRFKD